MDTSTSKPTQKLEIEDAAARQRRLQSTLERLNGSSTPRDPEAILEALMNGSSSGPSAGLPQIGPGNRDTFAVEPPTELMSRVHSFLPQMQAENERLRQRDAQELDIEHLEDEEGPYIEMDLGLGVYSIRRPGEVSSESGSSSDSEDSVSSSSISGDSSDDDEGSDSDSDSDDSESDLSSSDTSQPSPRIIKPLPRRRPMIEVVQETHHPA
ncbi:hypothetical protein HDZ31DRAFT_62129 [Schizophyllum fasciatum]